MPIRFAKMHVAASVANQILNLADELAAQPPIEMPSVPDNPAPGGEELDDAIRRPALSMPPVTDDPNAPANNALEPLLHGGASLDGLIDTTSGM